MSKSEGVHYELPELPDSLSGSASARSALYAAVADGFFDPTEGLIQNLADGLLETEVVGLLAQLPAATVYRHSMQLALDSLAKLARAAAAASPDATLHELRVEFARLFLGPGRPAVSPYETVHRRRNQESLPTLMISREAEAVVNSYREAGVALAPTHHEPPDDFATECEFLCYLCAQEAASATQKDFPQASQWRQRQVVFLEQHLGQWYGQFLTAVENEARVDYYRVIARLAAVFVSADLAAAGLEHLVSVPVQSLPDTAVS